MVKFQSQHGEVSTCPLKSLIELRIHSHTSTAVPLIPHFVMDVTTCPYKLLKLFHVTKMAQKVWCSTVFQQGVLVIITLTKTLTLYHILVFQQFFLFAIYPMRPAEDQNIPSGTKLPHFKTMIAWWPHRFRRLNIKILLPWLLCHMAPFKTDIPAAIPVVMGSDNVPGATVLG